MAVLGVGVLALVAATRGSAGAVLLDKPAQGCQAAIGKAALRLKNKYLGNYNKYLATELKAPGTGDSAKLDTALIGASGKFNDAVAKKCTDALLFTAAPAGVGFPQGGVGSCGTLWGEPAPEEAYEQACAALPVNSVATFNACARCFIIGELREWLKIHFPWVHGLVPAGSDLDCGVPPVVTLPPDQATLKCLSTIPKNANKLLITVEKVTDACLNSVRAGKISGGPGACPDAKGLASIQKTKDKLVEAYATACPSMPLWWDKCPESETPCAGNPLLTSVANISTCTNASVGSGVADEITCGLYPGAAADGVDCPGAPSLCGNGVLDAGEQCDPSAGVPNCPNVNNALYPCNASCTCACPSLVSLAADTNDPATLLDSGWTGIWHDAAVAVGGKITVTVSGCAGSGRPCGVCNLGGPVNNLNAGAGDLDDERCSGDTSIKCDTDADCAGFGTCEIYFGSLLPLSVGGISLCVENRVEGSISGTVNIETGAIAKTLTLNQRVSLGLTNDNPCPRCLGDGTPNDGTAAGTCNGGIRNGLACDANGTSPTPSFGTTSLDCPVSLNGLSVISYVLLALAPTTGTVTRTLSTSSRLCRAPEHSTERCFCETCDNAPPSTPCFTNADCTAVGATVCGGKRCVGGGNEGTPCTVNSECPGGGLCGVPGALTAPNACAAPDGAPDGCVPGSGANEGECADGPMDQNCAPPEQHRGCTIPNQVTDCPLTGTCIPKNRECFLDNGVVGGSIIAAGVADAPMSDVSSPELATVFCIGHTGNSTLNNLSGLPGPGRLVLKYEARGVQ